MLMHCFLDFLWRALLMRCFLVLLIGAFPSTDSRRPLWATHGRHPRKRHFALIYLLILFFCFGSLLFNRSFLSVFRRANLFFSGMAFWRHLPLYCLTLFWFGRCQHHLWPILFYFRHLLGIMIVVLIYIAIIVRLRAVRMNKQRIR